MKLFSLLATAPVLISAFSTGAVSAPADPDAVPPPMMGGPVDCANAEPQSPRDVSASSIGMKEPHMVPLSADVVPKLVHVNTHYHAGAEHKSVGEYDDERDVEVVGNTDTDLEYGNVRRRLLASGDSEMIHGFYCKTLEEDQDPAMMEPYDWQYCKSTNVGGTYELHWVHSSGGDGMGPGLGGAFARQHNPTIIVQGQVFVIVNDPSGSNDMQLMGGAPFNDLRGDKIMYIGSTTGTSYNNEDTCSPYTIHWHVDRKCQLVSAQSMDAMCKEMIDSGMEVDAVPHNSRTLVTDALASKDMEPLR